MNDRLNPKLCYFCSEASNKKVTLNPITRLLNELYLSATYQGRQYPVCSKCADYWNKEVAKVNSDYTKKIDILFESMVILKGASVEANGKKENEPPKQICSSDEQQNIQGS